MALSKPTGPNYKPRNIGNPVDPGPGIKPLDPYNDIGTTPDADLSDDGADSEPNIRATRVNRVQPSPPGRGTINITGYGQPHAFTLGRDKVVCPWCAGPAFASVHLYGGFEIGWGPIEEIEQVIINGVTRFTNLTENPHHGVIVTDPFTLITCTPYFGIPTQGVDGQLAALIPGYADTGVVTQSGETRGIAYLVLRIPAGVDSGAPTVEVVHKGVKTVLPSNGFASAPVWNDNPAAGLWAFLESPLIGRGLKVDPASVLAIENENNEMVNGEKRHTLNLHFTGRNEILDVQETISREYADCYVRQAANPAYDLELASARDRPFDMELTEADLLADGGSMVRVTGKGTRGQITRVLGAWRKPRTDDEPWGEQWIPVDADPVAIGNGTMRVVQEVIQLPGYHNYQAAYLRFVERLNAWRTENRTVEWLMRAKGVKIQRGDVIRLQYPLRGYVDYDVRVTGKAYEGPNRWRIFGHNHASTKYSTTPVVDPDYSTGGTTDPTTPPDLTGTVTAQEVIGPEPGGINIVARLKINFPAEDWGPAAGYNIIVTGGGAVFEIFAPQRTPGLTVEAFSPDLSGTNIRRHGTVFRVSVTIVSSLGQFESANPATADVRVYGRWAPPPDVKFTSAEVDTSNGNIVLRVTPVQDVGGEVRYRFKFSTDPTATWETATLLNNRATVDPQFIVTSYASDDTDAFYAFVKGVDTNGNESVNAGRKAVFVDTAIERLVLEDTWETQGDAFTMQIFDVLGQGTFALARDPSNNMLTRFDQTPTTTEWKRKNEPMYVDARWSIVQNSPQWSTVDYTQVFAVDRMRELNYQVELVETDPAINTNLSIKVRSVLYGEFVFQSQIIKFVSNRFGADIEKAYTSFPTDDDTFWIQFPVTHASRVASLRQSGTVIGASTGGNGETLVIFPIPYSETPVIFQPVATPSSGGRSISMSVVPGSASATQVTFVADAAQGGAQTYDYFWTVEGP